MISNDEDIFVFEKDDDSSEIPMVSFESITNQAASNIKKESGKPSQQTQPPVATKKEEKVEQPIFNLNILRDDEPQVRELDPEKARK